MSKPESPIIVILVPLFGHSVLVADALLAAIGQHSRYPFAVVVINDGCRYVESDLTVRAIVASNSGRIRYLAQPNGGLSAARNTGIAYALSSFEALQAIYFLDADNIIQPNAIDNAYTKLLEHPEASWVYPNIDMFGLRRHFDYGGPYSSLKHTRYNICEAGSLVHRRVFEAGVRFDESMRRGYEDWDFWLSAMSRGFRGVHLGHFGFSYRNRAESMLTQSKREDAEISAYLQTKHRMLLSKRNLMRLEALEAPRYAVFFTDTGEALVTAGVPGGRILTLTEFDELLWRNLLIPHWQHIPPIFVFTTRVLFEELTRLGLAAWVLHDCERVLMQMNIACVAIARKEGCRYEVRDGGRPRESGLLATTRDLVSSVIKDSETRWIENVQAPDPAMKVATRTLLLPRRSRCAEVDSGVVFSFLLRVLAWRASPYREGIQYRWLWRDTSVPPAHALLNVVRDAFGGEVVYAGARGTGRQIGFAISIGSFGGVERVAYNVARQFVRLGWQAHLFLFGTGALELPDEFAGIMTSVNFILDEDLNGWEAQNQYQGTALPAGGGVSRCVNRIVASLAWLDAVVNCHCGPLNVAAAALRQEGVKTLTHLHLLDHSPFGRSVGHSMIALAYEHAYDLVLCNSEQLTRWMHAAGIPREKLLRVANAPGHELNEAMRSKVLGKRQRPMRRQLNILYLGRLDRQKGIDRLALLIERTQRLRLPLAWRIVGSAVTDEGGVPSALAAFVEPAVLEAEAINDLLCWADVMILLSDYEGVPLTVLEAQRAGVCVIATNVGALSEIVVPGRTGFLVDVENAVEQALDMLTLLVDTPELRATIGAASARVPDWPETTVELIQRVTALVEAVDH